MNEIKFLYALSAPELETLSTFVEYIKLQVSDHGHVVVGVASDGDVPKIDGVVGFPAGTSPMSMFNQLAGRAGPDDVLFFSQGTSLPVIAPSVVANLAALPRGGFATLDSRRPILSQELELHEMLQLSWDSVEFTRSVHEESPLGIVVGRADFLTVRGFDERSSYNSTYLMDLLARFRRFAMVEERVNSLDAYSMDLEPVFSGLTSEPLPLNVSVRENQKIHVQSDVSIFRNLVSWSVPREFRPVLVTVAIATRDRSDYLLDSIRSVQNQSFQDWELVVIDDGSEDRTKQVVESVEDPRVRYAYQTPQGISAARNHAAEMSGGYFTAVHDDDDMMLPWRIETSLRTICAEAQASYGSWANFDDISGEMALHITKRGFGRELVAFSGQTPGHATWLLPTAIVRSLKYDETLTSSVDHNIAVRSVMSGVKWKHSEKVLFLRRIHPAQVSQTDSRRQRSAAVLTRYANVFPADFNGVKSLAERGKALTFPSPADKQRLFEEFGAYLPDHLVERGMTVQGLVGKKILAMDLHDRFKFIIAETDLQTDRSTLELGGVGEITWDDMVAVRASGFTGCTYTFKNRGKATRDQLTGLDDVGSATEIANSRALKVLETAKKTSASAVVAEIEGEHLSIEELWKIPGLLSARHLSVNEEPNLRFSSLLLGFREEKYAREYLDSEDAPGGNWSIFLPSQRDMEAAVTRHLGA
ncbi:glycosyltransferase family 2 protein [Arthrobacter rhombi]|uniref:glycosyltransferase family 2 protein n=1 Tax=Arthrobacter rhombi TaxID=71253 RepID=UPI003FD42D70